uniref:Uncharacterized protein n=1 Tax=Rhizophora mucronata TaxID=61149 RepID=A0A2P2NM95_RHIMU
MITIHASTIELNSKCKVETKKCKQKISSLDMLEHH